MTAMIKHPDFQLLPSNLTIYVILLVPYCSARQSVSFTEINLWSPNLLVSASICKRKTLISREGRLGENRVNTCVMTNPRAS